MSTITATNQPHPSAPPAADTPSPEYPPLTGHDRCDAPVSQRLAHATGRTRCGAAAYFRAVLDGEHQLLFCAHHGRENAPALAAQGIRVIDYTNLLTE